MPCYSWRSHQQPVSKSIVDAGAHGVQLIGAHAGTDHLGVEIFALHGPVGREAVFEAKAGNNAWTPFGRRAVRKYAKRTAGHTRDRSAVSAGLHKRRTTSGDVDKQVVEGGAGAQARRSVRVDVGVYFERNSGTDTGSEDCRGRRVIALDVSPVQITFDAQDNVALLDLSSYRTARSFRRSCSCSSGQTCFRRERADPDCPSHSRRSRRHTGRSNYTPPQRPAPYRPEPSANPPLAQHRQRPPRM